MLNANQENRKALASLLGIDEEEAAGKLETKVVITIGDPGSAAFASDLSQLVGKPRRQGCEFCGDKELTSAFASVWGFPPL